MSKLKLVNSGTGDIVGRYDNLEQANAEITPEQWEAVSDGELSLQGEEDFNETEEAVAHEDFNETEEAVAHEDFNETEEAVAEEA